MSKKNQILRQKQNKECFIIKKRTAQPLDLAASILFSRETPSTLYSIWNRKRLLPAEIPDCDDVKRLNLLHQRA